MKGKKHITAYIFFRIISLLSVIFVFSAFFYLNSDQEQEINKMDENGLKTGLWISNYDDGTVMEKGEFLEGAKHGIWKAWYRDGKLKHEITYDHGTARGQACMYYADGTLREAGFWNETCWIGEYRYYHPNGQTAYEWTYNEKGNREGEQIYYYSNGEKQYRGKWTNGNIDGAVEVYDTTGVMVQIRNYDEKGKFSNSSEINSNIHDNDSSKNLLPFEGTGYHTVYKLDGTLYKKGYFEKGQLITGHEYIYDNLDSLRQIRVFEGGRIVKIRSGVELENFSISNY